MYDFHNVVNQMLGKRIYLTYEDVCNKYEICRAKCNSNTRTETGCTIPVNNKKIQSVIHVVPLKNNREAFVIDKTCFKDGGDKISRKGSTKKSKQGSKR